MTEEELGRDLNYLAQFYETDERKDAAVARIREHVAVLEKMNENLERSRTAREGLMLAAFSSLKYDVLEPLLKRYVDLVNCGDCGFWDPETEAVVIAARAALQQSLSREQSEEPK